MPILRLRGDVAKWLASSRLDFADPHTTYEDVLAEGEGVHNQQWGGSAAGDGPITVDLSRDLSTELSTPVRLARTGCFLRHRSVGLAERETERERERERDELSAC